ERRRVPPRGAGSRRCVRGARRRPHLPGDIRLSVETSVRVVGAGPGVRRPVAVTMGARPDAVTRGPGRWCDLHAAVDCRVGVDFPGYPAWRAVPWAAVDRDARPVRSIGYGGYP